MLTLPPTHSMKNRCSAVCLLLPQIIHILHCLLAYSLLNYIPDFAVNWIQVMAVRPPQIQRDECMAVGFTWLLRMVSSDISDQDHGVRYRLEKTGRDWSVLISGVLNGEFVASILGQVSARPPQPYFLRYICTLAFHSNASGWCSTLIAAYSVMYLLFPTSSFTQKFSQ